MAGRNGLHSSTFCFRLAGIMFIIMLMNTARQADASGQLRISAERKLMNTISSHAESADEIGCAGHSSGNCREGAKGNSYRRACSKADHCRS